MQLWPHALRWRLTLWYSILFAAMIGMFAIGSYAVLRDVMVRRTNHFLEEARDAYVNELLVERGELPTDEGAVRAALKDVRFRDVRFLVYDRSLALVAESDSTAVGHTGARSLADTHMLDRRAIVARLASTALRESSVSTIPDDEGGYQLSVREVRLTTEHIVVAVQSARALQETLERVRLAFLVAIPLFLAMAGLGGYTLSRRALAPIVAMGQKAREISAANLNDRLPVGNTRDELGALAGVVNDLLARLEGAFEQQRRFVADASHELRTPVAIVRAESEIALERADRPAAEYRDALHVVQQAGDRLSRVVNDLFLLARADAGQQPLRRESLYLDEVVVDTARSLRTLAAQRAVALDLTVVPDAAYNGDPELLGRLLRNLLDNALQHAPPDSTVRVALVRKRDAWVLSVADEGEGIPPEAKQRVFDRFFRVDKARPRSGQTANGGAGLGLAIARLIADAHQGRLELVRSDGAQTVFAVTLPVHDAGVIEATT